jgi:alcohol dehydrogenase class IV
MALITYLTTVRFGFGVLAELPEDLTALGMERPLIVTDRGIAAAGLLERLHGVLGTRPRNVFDEVPSNLTEETALRALDQYRSEGCHGLIGFGGGSPIDLAIAMGLGAGTDLAAFVEDLNARIGLPGPLREMGVPASSVPDMALKADRDHSTATNPRPTTAADYAALLEDSIAA